MSNQIEREIKYWFPAKAYGWGWGLPSVWQAWMTIVLYLLLIALSVYIFPPAEQLFLFIFSVIVLSVLLIVICWIKGEPPKWRWGKR
jgi:hypothetical protein